MAQMTITGSCPRCGAPIFSEERTEQPAATRTCPKTCDFALASTPEERQLIEADRF